MKKLTKKLIIETLKEVDDPELNINIVDLGLVKRVNLRKNGIKIIMTLTTIGCPLISVIEKEIKDRLKTIGLTDKQVEIELNFDKPWTIEDMSPSARAMLGW